MASILQILRRIGGAKAPPATGKAGQLAMWKAGAAPTDAASLYAHDGTQWNEILDTSAQWKVSGANIYRNGGTARVNGATIISTGPELSLWASGVDFDGTNFIARATSGAHLLTAGGAAAIATGSGWTVGSVAAFVNRLSIDSIGSIQQVSNAVIGYGNNAGSTVTQSGDKSKIVVSNTPSGQIITAASSIPANGIVTFQVVNPHIKAGSEAVTIHRESGGSSQTYQIYIESVQIGSFTVSIRNLAPGPVAEVVNIRFAIISSSNR
jgi:hypothetical protein